MPLGKDKKTILGIDPGLADTGYGIIEVENNKLKAVAYGTIKTQKDQKLINRLLEIEKQLDKIIKKYQPDICGIEQLFFCKNVTTAMAVGQCRGVSMLVIGKNKLPVHEFTPLQVKQGVTGYGKADKKQIQQMIKIILNLKEIPQPDDAADALAIAVCASNSPIAE